MVRIEKQEGKLVCAFEGRLDTNKCQAIEQEVLASVGEASRAVVFDMQDVDYVASSFLRLCLMVSKQVGPGEFSMVNVHPLVKKVVVIANLSEFLRLA